MTIFVRAKSLTRLVAVNASNYWHSRGRRKIFCIGRNKTGTTSLARVFRDLGFVLGDQSTAEHLADKYYFTQEFKPITLYCRFGEVFQDVPFSWPGTYKYLDRAFPKSKFILTVRDDSEQWYRSITRFHAKKFGINGEPPTAAQLKVADYRRKGFMYNTVKVHGTPDGDPYNEKILKEQYELHNRQVIEYFQGRPDQLLVLNVAEKGAYQKLMSFLGISRDHEAFPWENRT